MSKPQIILTFIDVESATKHFDTKFKRKAPKGCYLAELSIPEPIFIQKPTRTVNDIRESKGLERLQGLDFVIEEPESP